MGQPAEKILKQNNGDEFVQFTDQSAPLWIHDLTVAYHRKPVLWDINLAVPEGKLVAIDKSTQQRLWPDVLFKQKQAGGFLGCAPGEQAVAIYGTPAATAELVYITGYNG